MPIARTAKLVAELKGPAGPGFLKGILPNGTNVNAFRTPGIWIIPTMESAESMVGLPEVFPGVLVIDGDPDVSTILCKQTYSTYRTGGLPFKAGIWDRLSAGAGLFGSWSRNAVEHGNAVAGTDLNDLTEGKLSIPGPINTQIINGPPDAGPGMVIHWTTRNFATMKAQMYFEYGPEGRLLYRCTRNVAGDYGPWRDAFAGGGGGAAPLFGAGTPNEMRIQAFKDAYPLATTGGKGVVVFRYDHGLTKFKSGILAAHVAAGIPYYIAMNSRNWGLAENSGATQADARAWLASGLAEFGNHCADHTDKTTAAGIHDTVVGGRQELETQLQTTIHGFTVPGVGGAGLGGFGAGTLDSYSSTYAGEVILANHAVCSGNIGSTQRRLDGQLRQGGKHYTWESATFSQVKAEIDAAVSGKTALTLMAHPSFLGDSGKFNTALVSQVVTYVKDLITAGSLAPMSYYQSHHAKL